MSRKLGAVVMKRPVLDQFSAMEVAITAFYVWAGFLVALILSNVVVGQTVFQQILVLSSGCIALAVLVGAWLRQKETRGHFINLLLFAVAGLIFLELLGLDY